MKRVLKIVCSDWKNASRDIRELNICSDLGMDVFVLARGGNNSENEVSNFTVCRKTTRPLGRLLPDSINRIVALFTWAYYARSLKPDVISGHDIDGLLIGFLSSMFQKKKPYLVYDSHELELGRNKKRGKLQSFFIEKLEGFLIHKCFFSIMVNDYIADIVQRVYHLEKRPIVANNIPSLWDVKEDVIQEKHASFCKLLGCPLDSFIVMYHGAIMQGRGVEGFIDVITRTQNSYGVILGYGADDYLSYLKEIVKNKKAESRIIFHNAVELSVLWQYVGAADLGYIVLPNANKDYFKIRLSDKDSPMINVPNTLNNNKEYKRQHGFLLWEKDLNKIIKLFKDNDWKDVSYFLSSPNKLFENIQSETPIIAAHSPFYESLVRKYNLGILCDPNNIDSIVSIIDELSSNRLLYNSLKQNVKIAKKTLCWEIEKNNLIDAYKDIQSK